MAQPKNPQHRPIAMSAVWPVPRQVRIPQTGAEKPMLVGYLDYYRETLELKCSGLPPHRLSERSVKPSTMSLHGLVRHLAGVERWWFQINFAGTTDELIYYSDDDPNQDFDDTSGDVAEALQAWRTECARSREIVEAAGLEDEGARRRHDGPFTLRWLMLRMIAEYAQHDGHADLLREATDGATGG